MNRQLSGAALAALLAGSAADPAAAQDAFVLDDIVFGANLAATEARRTGLSVQVLTAEDLAEAGDVEVIDVLARLPGLHVTRDGPAGTNASIRLRGLGEQYVAVRINGIDVSDVSSTQTEFNFAGLTTAGIGRIEVLYGSQSAIYGSEAIGGVIDIETVEAPDEPGRETTLNLEAGSYGTVMGSVATGLRTDRASLAFSATRLRTDGFSAAEENDGNTEADGHDGTTLTARGTFEATEALTLGFDLLAQDLDSEFDGGAGPGGDGPQTEETTRFGGRVFARVDGDAVSHEISASRSETRRHYPVGFTTDFAGDRTEVLYVGTWAVSGTDTLSFGLERSRESFAAGGDAGAVTTDAAFADAVLALSPDFDLSVSGRLDDHSVFGTQPTLRAAAAWRPDGATVLRASLGQGSRSPSLFELYSAFGDPALEPERSLSFDIGVERTFGDLTLGATAFWIEIDNLIDFDPASLACASGFGCYNQVPGTTETRGLELSASYASPGTGPSVFGNYTYTEAERGEGGRLARVPRHQVVVGLDGTLAAGIDYRLTGRGAFDTPVSAFAPNALEDYVVFDTVFRREIADGVEAYLRIENLFDAEYQTSPGYGTSDRAVYVGLRASF
jgi:vitamin B12 transporter